jgi:hypothetical protein
MFWIDPIYWILEIKILYCIVFMLAIHSPNMEMSPLPVDLLQSNSAEVQKFSVSTITKTNKKIE